MWELATPETSGRLSTSVRRKDISDRLGSFRELQLVNSYLGNQGPIITHASYPKDPRNQIAESYNSVFPNVSGAANWEAPILSVRVDQ